MKDCDCFSDLKGRHFNRAARHQQSDPNKNADRKVRVLVGLTIKI
jgi:hypothetical protein